MNSKHRLLLFFFFALVFRSLNHYIQIKMPFNSFRRQYRVYKMCVCICVCMECSTQMDPHHKLANQSWYCLVLAFVNKIKIPIDLLMFFFFISEKRKVYVLEMWSVNDMKRSMLMQMCPIFHPRSLHDLYEYRPEETI